MNSATASLGRYPILLVVPPCRSIVRPALSVSLLKANLPAGEFDVSVLYLNLVFADQVGPYLHEALGSVPEVSLGDFVFACILFDTPEESVREYVSNILLGTPAGRALLTRLNFRDPLQGVQELIESARRFASEAVDRMMQYEVSLMGVTSSFQENPAALLLCHRLKERQPEIRTVMGGANCQGSMGIELLRCFPQVDYVAQGECDLTFPALAQQLRNGAHTGSIPGILSRQNHERSTEPHLSSADLENSPAPDFSDYFSQLAERKCRRVIQPGLPLETSRGCWWGAKGACRFCGLNGELAFRRKSAGKALMEIEAHVERYGMRSFNVVDNMLDMHHIRDLFPHCNARPQMRFFWETPGRLSRSQIRTLAKAGVTHIQPGIESLSDQSLELMHKPTSRLDNVQTLKWCDEYGIVAYWNHLFGVPGESDADVEQIARDATLLAHLSPPAGAHMIRLQRFSRYFEEQEKYGFERVRPIAVYSHIYPFKDNALQNLAYHFENDWSNRRATSQAFHELQRAMQQWRRKHMFSALVSMPLPGIELVIDTRPGRTRTVHLLPRLEQRILEATDRACSQAQIADTLGLPADHPGMQAALKHLESRGLLLSGCGRFLALPVPLSAKLTGRGIFRFRPMPGGHLRWRRTRQLVRSLRLPFLPHPEGGSA